MYDIRHRVALVLADIHSCRELPCELVHVMEAATLFAGGGLRCRPAAV